MKKKIRKALKSNETFIKQFEWNLQEKEIQETRNKNANSLKICKKITIYKFATNQIRLI